MKARSTALIVACGLIASVLAGCAGSGTASPPADRGPGGEGLQFPDGPGDDVQATDTSPADWGADVKPAPDALGSDGSKPNPCVALTADGIAQNPGCDADFQAIGPTALGQFASGGGDPLWLFCTKTKYWLYNTALNAFTDGGKDIAKMLRGLDPTDCLTLASDGKTPLNPGCDPLMKVNGPSTLGAFANGSGQPAWLLTSGTRFWLYDQTKGAFTVAGDDVAAATSKLAPANCTASAGGMLLNPGCSTAYRANGPTAWGDFKDPTSGKPSWLFVSGTEYWSYDPAAGTGGAFTAAGPNLGAALAGLLPACSATAKDGTALNPGCDASFNVNGPTSVGALSQLGSPKPLWLFTSGTKYWLYDVGASGGKGAFTAAGANIATVARTLSP